MLRFRNERITVALCPEQVAILKSEKGHQSAVDELRVFAAPEAGRVLWRESVSALADWLQRNPQKRRSISLILSNRFVRFAMLPWAENAQGEPATQALANACLETQYGDMSGWTIRIDDGRYGQAKLVCAMETALLDSLQSAVTAHACARVEPYFVTCWNRWRKTVQNGDALFAVSESGVMVIASIKNGRWQSVRALSGQLDRTGGRGLLSRESLLQGFAEPPACCVHSLPLGLDATKEEVSEDPELKDKLIALPLDVQVSAAENFSAAKIMVLIGSAS